MQRQLSSHRVGVTPRRARSLLMTLVLTITTAVVGVVNADGAAAASGCVTPVASITFKSQGGSTWAQGMGDFGCTNANKIASKVDVYYKMFSVSPYERRSSSGWKERGSWNYTIYWKTYAPWTMAPCGFWMVRAWVRWKYDGASAYTYSEQIRTYKPRCG